MYYYIPLKLHHNEIMCFWRGHVLFLQHILCIPCTAFIFSICTGYSDDLEHLSKRSAHNRARSTECHIPQCNAPPLRLPVLVRPMNQQWHQQQFFNVSENPTNIQTVNCLHTSGFICTSEDSVLWCFICGACSRATCNEK